jgi:hypothetical protein
MPASAFAMHRRIEAVLAFNADPEGRIRRLARRAARRTAAAIAAAAVASIAPPLAAQAAAAVAPVVVTPAIAPRIRAPPKPGNLLEAIGVSLEEEVTRPANDLPQTSRLPSAGARARATKYPQGSRPVIVQHNTVPAGALPRRHSAFGRIRQSLRSRPAVLNCGRDVAGLVSRGCLGRRVVRGLTEDA